VVGWKLKEPWALAGLECDKELLHINSSVCKKRNEINGLFGGVLILLLSTKIVQLNHALGDF
jgi:hypothetical protein